MKHSLPGGWYMAWLKQVSKSFKISVRLLSKRGSWGAAWAKPTPASQMNSQLSIEWRSSCLSYVKAISLNIWQNWMWVCLLVPVFCWNKQWNPDKTGDHTGHSRATGLAELIPQLDLHQSHHHLCIVSSCSVSLTRRNPANRDLQRCRVEGVIIFEHSWRLKSNLVNTSYGTKSIVIGYTDAVLLLGSTRWISCVHQPFNSLVT